MSVFLKSICRFWNWPRRLASMEWPKGEQCRHWNHTVMRWLMRIFEFLQQWKQITHDDEKDVSSLQFVWEECGHSCWRRPKHGLEWQVQSRIEWSLA
jgi:hypothetical protein